MIKVTLRNYRGFTSESPASFIIGDGFTALVGKNNAGKSTCLRAIFELRNIFNNPNKWIGLDQHNNPVDIQCPTEPDATALLNFDNSLPAFVSIEIEPALQSNIDQLIQSTVRIERNGKVFLNSIKLTGLNGLKELKPPFSNQGLIELGASETAAQVHDKMGQKFVFNYLQFAATLQSLAQSVYYGPYRNAINEGAGQYYDIAVGTGLISQWDQWKAGASISNKRAIARVEADVARLTGYNSVEINASSDNKSLDVTVDKHPFKLADLGAGVAELIITLSNALVKKPPFILIDEPESHLHPSLQVDFLTTLASYSTNGIAFSTHSIGLARSIADRIYGVSRENNISSCAIFEKQTHLAELLGNLSYSGYFPAENAYVLLVEGSTEVKTFQVLLRKLRKDHTYVILPLGGSSLIRENSDVELGEVVRIAGAANKVFAIIDSEKSNENAKLDKQHEAFNLTCQKFGISLLITERRATENYFSDKAIKKAMGDSYAALSNFGARSEHANSWPKNENWRIASHESEDFFSSHDLGKFLYELPSK